MQYVLKSISCFNGVLAIAELYYYNYIILISTGWVELYTTDLSLKYFAFIHKQFYVQLEDCTTYLTIDYLKKYIPVKGLVLVVCSILLGAYISF